MTVNSCYSSTGQLQLEWQQQAHQFWLAGKYVEASQLYEEAIAQDPECTTNYWYLGLGLVLQGREEEARLIWMTPILEAESEEHQAQFVTELIGILQSEVLRQEENLADEMAWVLCQHIREFIPNNIENLLRTLQFALKANLFSFEDGLLSQINLSLRECEPASAEISSEHLLHLVSLLLDTDPGQDEVLNFLTSCYPYLTEPLFLEEFLNLLLNKAGQLHQHSIHHSAGKLASLCAKLAPNNLKVLFKLLPSLQCGNVEGRVESISVAERCLALSTHLSDRIMATNFLLSSWIYSGGSWQQAIEIYHGHKALLHEFLESVDLSCDRLSVLPPNSVSPSQPLIEEEPMAGVRFFPELLAIGSLFHYFEDDPKNNRPLRNQLAAIAQTHLQERLAEKAQKYQQRSQTIVQSPLRLPRIGYFAGSLRTHSVGWLCRWLFKHHDRDRFDIHLYSPRQFNDFIQQQFINDYGENFHSVPLAIADIADKIYDDQIDILIELDSLTSYGGCGVVALKPAPIQVHWLGFDSSGIPGVDYFIADPYVLPESAQDYYRETIWRLPHTYIAVDGFESHLLSLRRDQLDIPGDAVVYLSSQTGMKRNTENVRLQLRVIKEVSNSYFLIKSFRANPEFVETFFRELAEEEGVSRDRLRFLPDAPSSFVHRANLGLADIVLDTYPYNGATTTLESLWMGLPIVTRVGEQFAARNSYGMMMNVGVTEGIAWTDEEYVEWGVRLGKDAALRSDIYNRLRRSRHTSPLWNGQQFAREMEKAYEQMWETS